MTFAAWKESYNLFFPEPLDFFQLENSIKFVLLKLYISYFVSMTFSHMSYTLAHDFFSIGIFERSHCSTSAESLRARGSHQTRIYKHPRNTGLETICCKSMQWHPSEVTQVRQSKIIEV